MRGILACLSLVLLAGCTASNGADGQSAGGGGNLAYNGASNGSHTDSFESDGSCVLHLSANLGSGKVTVTLRTAEGTTVQANAAGPGQVSKAFGEATGSPGTWTLRAERTNNDFGPFSGQYAASATC